VLKKENRLKSKKEFDLVKMQGRMHQSKSLGWLELRTDQVGVKIGMIVSKKISSRAVDRNKVRRRLANAVANNISKIKKGARVIILGKKGILEVKEEMLELEIGAILENNK